MHWSEAGLQSAVFVKNLTCKYHTKITCADEKIKIVSKNYFCLLRWWSYLNNLCSMWKYNWLPSTKFTPSKNRSQKKPQASLVSVKVRVRDSTMGKNGIHDSSNTKDTADHREHRGPCHVSQIRDLGSVMLWGCFVASGPSHLAYMMKPWILLFSRKSWWRTCHHQKLRFHD